MLHPNRAFTHIALGAAAGLAGTLLMQGLLAATKKWLPQGMPPMKRDPGEHMVTKAHNALPNRIAEYIPEKVENIAAKSLGMGYGASFGAAYAAMRPASGSTLIDGAVLGVATWAAGYLGWLPASGVMPPIWKHRPTQIAIPIIEHALYGIATVAAYDWMHRMMHNAPADNVA